MTSNELSFSDLFADDSYTIKQSLIRNKYAVTDSADDLVVRAKQKLFKMKEEFPFVDADGDVVFRAKADEVIDIAGDYSLIDEETGEEFATLDKNLTLIRHVWKIRDPDDGEELAVIQSKSTFLQLLRSLSDIASLIPHSYTITSGEKKIGKIKGKFRLHDTYDLKIFEKPKIDRATLVASAIAVDALEHN